MVWSVCGGKPRGSPKRILLNDKIKRLYKRANGIVSYNINRTVSGITAGTDAVAHASLCVNGMTVHGGNRKPGTGRSMRGENSVVGFNKTECKVRDEWYRYGGIPSHQHNMPQVWPHARPRVDRDTLICVYCTSMFHADANAAWGILHGGERRLEASEEPYGDKPKPCDFHHLGARMSGMGVCLCI